MRKTWFIGCPHFGHANIIELARRPFGSLDEMNATMVTRWCARVSEDDLVYILGDFSWDDPASWLDQLPGSKIMILGNHDDRRIWRALTLGGYVADLTDYRKFEVSHGDQKREIVLFHYPIEDWDGRFRGSIHLHAHTHDHTLERPALPWLVDSYLVKSDEQLSEENEARRALPPKYPCELVCNRFCVGVEATDYAPISLDEILTRSHGEHQ